jgi:Icc-related predicted phosphoesterase
MRLLGITDLHGGPAALDRILAGAGPVDLILLGGDLTNFGAPADAEKMVRQAEATGTKVLAVAGNCDSAEIDRRLAELGVSLVGRGVVHDGVGLHGLSAMPPWRGDMYQLTEDELAEVLRAGYAQIAGVGRHVLLSHPPPHGGRLDCTSAGKHVGSTALRDFIDETQPELVLCGHIHEARGVEKLGRTTAVNCGPAAAGFYALAELGDELKVDLRRAW